MKYQDFMNILDVLDTIDYESTYIPTIKELMDNEVGKNFEQFKEYLLYISEQLAAKGTNLTTDERELNIFLNDLFSKHIEYDDVKDVEDMETEK